MIIKSESIWHNPEKIAEFDCFLIYGQNYEKVSYLTDLIIEKLKEKPLDFRSIISFDNEDLKNNPNCISENLKTTDIFGEKKILLISTPNPDLFFKKITFPKNEAFDNCKIIIRCSELNKNNKIRKLFESSNNFLCSACYEHSDSDIKDQIVFKFKKEGIKLDDELLLMLTSYLKLQKNSFNNELEKIIIYLKKGGLLTEKKLSLIVNQGSDFSLEEFIYCLVSGKIHKFDRLFYLMEKNNINEISILTVLVKHFYKLLYYKMELFKTRSKSLAIKSLYPPIFFKLKQQFILQSDLWSIESIEKTLSKLLNAEKKLKTNSIFKESYTKFLLFSICKLANKKQK